MVARTQPTRSTVVVFERDGAEPETRYARDSQHALVVALGMLAARSMLFVGDHLYVRAEDCSQPEQLPETSRSSHYS